MSQVPTPYTRKNNFASDALNPTLELADTCEDLDAEFDAIRSSVNQTISRLNEIQRDDGLLRSEVLDPADYALFQSAVTSVAGAQQAQQNAESAFAAAQNAATSAASSSQQAQASAGLALQYVADTDALKSQAAQSATNAQTSLSQATAAAALAQSSAASAASSYDSALGVYDQFDDRYLGSKATDPSTDNDGQTLLVGALYFNTTNNELRVWNGSAWASSAQSKYNTQVPSSTTNVVLFNGMMAETANTWKNRTFVEALDAILFPTIAPTYSSPFVSVSRSAESGVELGAAYSSTLTPTWMPGDAGSIQSYQWFLDGASQGVVSASSLASLTGSSTGTARIDVTFAEGAQKLNNKGQLQGDPPGPGTIQSATVAAPTRLVPWFYMKSPTTFSAAQFLSAISSMSNSVESAPATGVTGATITRVLGSADTVFGTNRVGVRVPYNLSNECLGVAVCVDSVGGFTSKQGFFVNTVNKGPITAAFAVSSVTSVSRQGGLWTKNFIFYITPGLSVAPDAFIELTNSASP